ncbi:MAG: hypothetical protein COT17_05995 [Elusimicrobia bacterium CG08_land_8_20_14_0_20_51_18]|nr:MAG: hypothetical protein COT17_05995 [Elusimicrobia bacterium CG08_land_8_20_14_0_20_51_18]
MPRKSLLAAASLILLLSTFSHAGKPGKKNQKKHLKISTETVKAQKPRVPKRAGPAKNYWDVNLSTAEIAAIKQEIDSLPKIRGIHITAWIAGDEKLRKKLLEKVSASVINSVVVAVKEMNGKVYLPGVEKAYKWGSHENAIPDPEKMMKDFKKLKLYTMARVVCFHDSVVPAKNTALAVKNPEGSPWKSRKGDTWVDPYSREVWDYLLDVAERAAELGFDEIQFDYIRYPTEGDTKLCRFSQVHNKENATKNIAAFLKYARKRLSKYGVKLSADVFGLTTGSDMGIGQDLNLIAENVDYVYPMMYPSHYYNREYDLANPDSQPYKLIDRGLKHALGNTGRNYAKIRPYLQDFSLKWKYGPNELRAQIIAAKGNMLDSWILWNPSGKYSWEALTPQMYRAFVDPEWK